MAVNKIAMHRARLARMEPVCTKLAEGHSLAMICDPEKRKEDPNIPSRRDVLKWVAAYPDIREMYQQARRIGFEVWGDELRMIAQGVLDGKLEPNAARVSADITKWTLAHLAPRKWSDRAIEEAFSGAPENEIFKYTGLPANLIGPSFGHFIHDVYNDVATHYWLKGGRGSLKSTTISEVLIDDLMRHTEGHIVVAREYQNTLKDSVYTQLLWSIEQLGLTNRFVARKSPLEISNIETGQTIYFRGLDDPLKMKSIKPKAGYIRNIWFEEVAEIEGGMATIRNVLQSLMRGGEKFNVFYSYNPPRSKNNWVNVAVEAQSSRKDTKIYTSNYLEAPAQWLGRPFLLEADHLKATSPQAYEHEYLGVPIGYGGDVFENVILDNISHDLSTEVMRFGVDFGFGVDPFVWMKVGYNRLYDTLYILDEFVSIRVHDDQAARLIKQKGVANIQQICDSADPKAIDNLRREGINAYGCTKFAGSRDHGYKHLQKWDRIIIDRQKCPNAAREFTACEYEKDKHGNFVSSVPKRDDHTIDAVRYALDHEINQSPGCISIYASTS